MTYNFQPDYQLATMRAKQRQTGTNIDEQRKDTTCSVLLKDSIRFQRYNHYHNGITRGLFQQLGKWLILAQLSLRARVAIIVSKDVK